MTLLLMLIVVVLLPRFSCLAVVCPSICSIPLCPEIYVFLSVNFNMNRLLIFMSRFSGVVDVVYQGIYQSVLYHSVKNYELLFGVILSYRVLMVMESVVYDKEHHLGPDYHGTFRFFSSNIIKFAFRFKNVE